MIDCNCSACTGDIESTSPHWENVLPEINHLEIEREGKKNILGCVCGFANRTTYR